MNVDPIANELLAVLPLITRLVAAEVRREGGEETTVGQFLALELLADAPMSLSMLARTRHVSMQTMGEVVQTLVQRGWVERTQHPNDRRSWLLMLTPDGREHHDNMRVHTLERMAPFLNQLNDDERVAVQTAFVALRRIFARVEERRGIDQT